jgi:hypothetical protein
MPVPIRIKNANHYFFSITTGITLVSLLYLISSCKHEKLPAAAIHQRGYRMGFQNFPPKADANTILQALNMWTQRADAAIISVQVPWESLYSGTSPETYIGNNFAQLVDFYRSKNLKLWVYIDPANGLDRSADATDLAALHKSIAQVPVQKVYERFCFLMDSLLKPDHMGLALETNLIRGSSPDSIYQGIKSAANQTAVLVSAYDHNVRLSVSIQADYAWGLLTAGSYQGIDKDLIDFPFVQELGISSYPYFVFDKPQDIPLNYYARLIQGHSMPVFISEGGWSSQTVTNFAGTPQKQQDYIDRQAQLLSQVNAIAYFQLLFSDLNVAALPAGVPDNVNLFVHIGLTDTTLQPKPALKNWDTLFKQKLVTGY